MRGVIGIIAAYYAVLALSVYLFAYFDYIALLAIVITLITLLLYSFAIIFYPISIVTGLFFISSIFFRTTILQKLTFPFWGMCALAFPAIFSAFFGVSIEFVYHMLDAGDAKFSDSEFQQALSSMLSLLRNFPSEIYAAYFTSWNAIIWILNEAWNFFAEFFPAALTVDLIRQWADNLPTIFESRLDLQFFEKFGFENKWAKAASNLLFAIIAGLLVRIIWSVRPKRKRN